MYYRPDNEPRAHIGQLSPHRPVIYPGTDLRRDAADQVRIDREPHAHAALPQAVPNCPESSSC